MDWGGDTEPEEPDVDCELPLGGFVGQTEVGQKGVRLAVGDSEDGARFLSGRVWGEMMVKIPVRVFLAAHRSLYARTDVRAYPNACGTTCPNACGTTYPKTRGEA